MALSRDVSATSKYSAALEKKLTPRQIEEAALSLEPATPDEARQMLDLKGRNAVSF